MNVIASENNLFSSNVTKAYTKLAVKADVNEQKSS